jgi:hypothetical protein
VKDYLGHNEEVHILSLGTGATKLMIPYKEAADKSKVSELKSYLSEERQEGVYDQLHKAYTLAGHLPNLHVYRMDCVLSPKEDSLDALGSIPAFINYGKLLVPKIPEIFLRIS